MISACYERLGPLSSGFFSVIHLQGVQVSPGSDHGTLRGLGLKEPMENT